MKKTKIVSALVAFALMLSLLSVTVCAEEEAGEFSAYLLSGTVRKDEEITVRFALNGLENTDGALLVESHLEYNKDALRFVSAVANHPENWSFGGESDYAEDWTCQESFKDGENEILKPSVLYVIMNAELKNPVKEDGVLFVDVTFKVLDDSTTPVFSATGCFWASYDEESEAFVKHDLPDKELVLSETPPEKKTPVWIWYVIGGCAALAVIAAVVVALLIFKKKKKKS